MGLVSDITLANWHQINHFIKISRKVCLRGNLLQSLFQDSFRTLSENLFRKSFEVFMNFGAEIKCTRIKNDDEPVGILINFFFLF